MILFTFLLGNLTLKNCSIFSSKPNKAPSTLVIIIDLKHQRLTFCLLLFVYLGSGNIIFDMPAHSQIKDNMCFNWALYVHVHGPYTWKLLVRLKFDQGVVTSLLGTAGAVAHYDYSLYLYTRHYDPVSTMSAHARASDNLIARLYCISRFVSQKKNWTKQNNREIVFRR